MRFTKTLGMAGALILSAVLGGTLIGSALATDETTDDDTTTGAGSEYCQTFLDEVATQLGTTREALTDAGRAAALATVDAAVAAGDLTEERAATLRERIESADGDGCGWFGHGWARGFHAGAERGEVRGVLGADVFEAAAAALGIDSSELIGQLRDAGSLQALAETQGVSYDEVTASILVAIQDDLDAAVAEGLDQEHADAVIERLTEWLDEGGQFGGFGGFGGFGPGHRGFGPGPFHGPRGGDDDTEERETDAEDGSGA